MIHWSARVLELTNLGKCFVKSCAWINGIGRVGLLGAVRLVIGLFDCRASAKPVFFAVIRYTVRLREFVLARHRRQRHGLIRRILAGVRLIEQAIRPQETGFSNLYRTIRACSVVSMLPPAFSATCCGLFSS